ncbi:DUF2057 domain-containing protein [Glaesserella parasuis]|uniref:curli polymerization inhibitor CsgI-related protein n=1 Tax=Glaesserella parasuis TaxID=738 RepID=UPI00135D1B45|nr:DUF2057 domain-containing protein [Glaesserella parasuis]MDG6285877.1 DUF2057 domain-containing protein [Glaesserella parasuis]MDG6288012.1 DUF2057 domain-containing protein [Glaesserella parasuis]MDG6290037.1 DUF2057 domain-containing protein [Glaesserella parasuis]MDG6292186.1 DUF2057 domain-containing protein [Glaesserella parasuis]MDP0042811.1 DUF2057 domain-containing protein [Glaesserella parasuis]
MKLGKIALAMTALIAGTTAFAGTITGSSNVTFLAFDGQKVRRNTNLQVNDTNLHQVVVEISSIYQSGSDSAFFESQPIILTFEGSTEDIKILAPSLNSEFDIAQFKKSPSFKIETVSGKKLTYKQDFLKGEGFMPNSNIINNLANYNIGEGVAAVQKFALSTMPITMANNTHKVNKGKIVVQGENVAEQQLQYWFQQADKETQKRFLDWAKKQ